MHDVSVSKRDAWCIGKLMLSTHQQAHHWLEKKRLSDHYLKISATISQYECVFADQTHHSKWPKSFLKNHGTWRVQKLYIAGAAPTTCRNFLKIYNTVTCWSSSDFKPVPVSSINWTRDLHSHWEKVGDYMVTHKIEFIIGWKLTSTVRHGNYLF